MTTTETTPSSPHRRKRSASRFARLVLGVCIALMLGAVVNLYAQQMQYQQCVADYLAKDSKATHQRTGSSASTINSLVAQSVALGKALDPAHQPPSPEVRQAALDAITQVPLDAKKYNAKIKAYPYPVYTCGGESPK